MAYIDSELAKRRQGSSVTIKRTSGTGTDQHRSSADDDEDEQDDHGPSAGDYTQAQRQPATMGRIQEIDLGREEAQVVPKKKPPKVRLGPDGKPWRSRKRRGSDDIKRDSIVEQVLRENKSRLLMLPHVSIWVCIVLLEANGKKLSCMKSLLWRQRQHPGTVRMTTALQRNSGENS